ncbi:MULTISPECIES: hypothetical protein [unclassified Pseudomonas]|uniref:hypothetical protein n=1 Tax=unclassified Pseudomonas TaxID=196821 RepID=UPI002448DFB5|nr:MULTISPECIES: hypothetical protein [unclassified Pseudomonas]MDG9928542.1 hypothetical protein [Pseudomonas sp. GD04042]MDH0482712.1 hypothetical protein [Pseudomonas sp. GD04015]MDH0604586.1 hypothetical protein [Pseudomonas sp. GD03869]
MSMYRFENYWEREIALSEYAEAASLDLPDGRYRLALRDAGRTRYEIVEAVVESGAAALGRGCEGTDQQDWPAGSFIYLTLTAEQITHMSGLSIPGYPGVDGVIAPACTLCVSELDGSVWVCVWSDGEASDWVELQHRTFVGHITSGGLGFSEPGSGEWLLADGVTAEFGFQDVIYSNVELAGVPRVYQSSGLTHLRTQLMDSGPGMVLIATPLAAYEETVDP